MDLRDEYGLRPMSEAPRDSTSLLALVVDEFGNRRWTVCHWAQDLSGEEQPPFRGWFDNLRHVQISARGMIGWRAFDPTEPTTLRAEIERLRERVKLAY